MKIILKSNGAVIDEFSNQLFVPCADDRIVLNDNTVFRIERRYIDLVKQETVLEGFKYQKP